MDDLISRQAAIDNLERYRDLFSWDDGDKERAILSRVIKELQSMPSVKPTRPTPSNTLGALDCVERQAAMKIRFSSGFDHDGILFVPYRDVEEHLKQLPSVQPRKGKWIDIKHTFMTKCSVCDWINNDDSSYNFCPRCGADMREKKKTLNEIRDEYGLPSID